MTNSRKSDQDNMSRSLTDEARAFVRGEKPGEKPSKPKLQHKPKTSSTEVLPQMTGRHPLTIKLKPQVASELKRISILSKLTESPITMQQIAEEAIEQWIKTRGHEIGS